MPIKRMLSNCNSIWMIAMVCMFIILNYTSSVLQHNMKTASNIARTETLLLQLRRNEKDFFTRKKEKYAEMFNKNMVKLQLQLGILEDDFSRFNYTLSRRKNIKTVLKKYHHLFEKSVMLQRYIGFNEQDGLYGELRAAIRNIEQLLDPEEYRLHKIILQLRRNEKDFIPIPTIL